MIEKIYDVLSQLQVPVRYGWYDENINQQHVTYFVALESISEYEDDDESSLNYVVQVDVWSREDDTQICKEIRKILKTHSFKFIESADLFEVDTKIYHKAMRFNYYQEV